MAKKKTNKQLFKESFNELMDLDNINPHIKIVKVCWNDANTNHDGLWLKDIYKQKLLPVETIGYLLDENEERIIVGGMFFWDEKSDILDPNGESVFKDVHIIPKSQIKTILVLKIDYEESKKFKVDKLNERESK